MADSSEKMAAADFEPLGCKEKALPVIQNPIYILQFKLNFRLTHLATGKFWNIYF